MLNCNSDSFEAFENGVNHGAMMTPWRIESLHSPVVQHAGAPFLLNNGDVHADA
jgi:hypothetical protein